jgi:S-adenosylmethionine/arginine decarboxylase-like enzyme
LQFISVDIYTCKEFDVNDAIDTIKQFYSPIEMILTVNSKKKGAEP